LEERKVYGALTPALTAQTRGYRENLIWVSCPYPTLFTGLTYGSSYEPSDRQEHDRPRQPEQEADKKKPAPDIPGPTSEVRETSEKK
jgi:hypothetical protein